MTDYDFTKCLSFLDFEALSKDLLEAELNIQLESFSEGRDEGVDLRHAPIRRPKENAFKRLLLAQSQESPELIVQCKRYSKYSDLKSTLKNKELPKLAKLNPGRYILTTTVSLTKMQVDEIQEILSPYVLTTGDIYGRERLASILAKHEEIERRHVKLWVTSSGVLDSIVNAKTHLVSREELERTISAAKVYVRNPSFDEALEILKAQRVCIISGLPGIGKTTLARMLLLYFYDKKFDLVKIESDISEARSVGYHNKPRFYFYDDFLGQTAQADKLNKNEDQKLLDFMASVRSSKESVFVLTTREYILNQARAHYEKLGREKFDHRTCVIDLTKYSRRIRAQILYNHLHFSGLPRTHLDNFVSERGYLSIVDHKNYNPRLIEYLTDINWIGDIPSKEYFSLFLRNLDNPVEIWGHAFRHQLSVGSRHLLFVLTTMPSEAVMEHVERAFSSLHITQCDKLRIGRSATDFMSALKELDGTFVASRKIGNSVLIRFQNPSIRDFMKNLLLSGEMLSEMIESTKFFEQAKWFSETLCEKNPQVSIHELSLHSKRIADRLVSLMDAASCFFYIFNEAVGQQKIYFRSNNEVERLAIVARALKKSSENEGGEWIDKRLTSLSERVSEGALSPSYFHLYINSLWELDCLNSVAGRQLVEGLKSRLANPVDLEDFEIVAKMLEALPTFFVKAEVDEFQSEYEWFIEKHFPSDDVRDPEHFREEASVIESVGEALNVDTNVVQARFRDHAEELEKDEREDDGDEVNDWGRGGADGNECTDNELDSIFGTLKE